MSFRKRLYLILDPKEKGGMVENLFEFILITIIILNIVAIVLASIPEEFAAYHDSFHYFEIFSVIFFTIEYVARIYCIVENPMYRGAVLGRLKYAKTGMAIVDLLAFLPFYLTFLPIDLRFLRALRLMALFRLFKITRYMQALDIFKRVMVDRREQLLLSFVFILFVLVIISFFMFYAEREAQPDKFGSIPEAMWWGVETITTVGYGDVFPVTPWGKVLGGLFAISGVLFLALPTGILTSGFFELLHRPKGKVHTCPHCGKDFHD